MVSKEHDLIPYRDYIMLIGSMKMHVMLQNAKP